MSAAAKTITELPTVSRFKPETAESFAPYPDDGVAVDPWVTQLRASGLEALKIIGLPTQRLERWKYTNLPRAVKGFGDTLGSSDVVYKDPDNLVQKIPSLLSGTPDWLRDAFTRAPAYEQSYGDAALWHLCNAYLRDGLVIDVPAGHIGTAPIDITIIGHDGSFFVPRTVFRLGEGAELTIIEHHTGAGRYWNNRLTQIILGPNAKLRHYRIQENSAEAVYTQNTHVQCGRDSRYEGFTLAAGSALSRNQLHAEMLGTGASCDVYGLNTLGGSQHGDSTIEIEHKVPHCNSSQFIRSVLRDQAHGVFQGKAHVHEGADQTDAQQLSNALLLSEGAEMDTKPELEIYADEVQCAHGATTGRLEDAALFYMRTRGIDEQAARALLIQAFVGELVEKLADETVRELVLAKVQKWLG